MQNLGQLPDNDGALWFLRILGRKKSLRESLRLHFAAPVQPEYFA